MATNKPQSTIGVIVGRFQVHQLTQGHRDLVDFVLSQGHSRVILFLGVPRADVRSTKRNPLPFAARRDMFREAYSGQLEIYPMEDVGETSLWVKNLDKRIAEVTDNPPINTVTLYGSRDSFVETYDQHKGCYLVKTFTAKNDDSGTAARALLKTYPAGHGEEFNTGFRAGCIFTTERSWTCFFPTVDAAIFEDESLEYIYLGRKSTDDRYRFVGGFADAHDETMEKAAMREAKEETSVTTSVIGYVCTAKIDDRRYRNEYEKIMTTFYALVKKSALEPRADDDLAEVKKFKFSELTPDAFIPAHRPLFEKLKVFVKNHK